MPVSAFTEEGATRAISFVQFAILTLVGAAVSQVTVSPTVV